MALKTAYSDRWNNQIVRNFNGRGYSPDALGGSPAAQTNLSWYFLAYRLRDYHRKLSALRDSV